MRSTGLDDNRARLAAADSASAALLDLRTAQKSDQALSEEAPRAAFTRLRKDIGPMLRHHDANIEFVAPAGTGRPLPGEVAHAARDDADAVLAFTAQTTLARLRIAWTSDHASLLVDVRDQGSGDVDMTTLRRQLQGRARTVGATLDLDAAPGWGSRVTISLPLDPPADPSGESRLTTLNRREHEVLALLAQGMRNKAIAAELGITESTVKFHVTGVLQKLEVTSRGEAAALALTAGIGTPASS
ncbi:helix-turn-helix transcriptional regulator [Amycolatopsis magusensis]|uniref:helix-turn-helix transcriptional regulator n=1 Tax=Amycolatopsis magusensis TaxID=882444 RepID=UPI00378F4E3A